ncbi:hypothetical protein CEB3_c27550 [Peptococcaceae bacterium CEB3]|nr:hypothetical protein CEB3_c27550 [Peptococcaceae bacterium CEB3]
MKTTRLWLIDRTRAGAILLMITYHLVYDLNRFAGVGINYESPVWYAIGKASALLFIFLSGFCSALSRHPVRRGIRLLAYGLGISAVTFLFLPAAYVRFGILHFLAVALILSPLWQALPQRLLPLLALLAGLAGWKVAQLSGPTGLGASFLLPLGLKYPGFDSIDYFPLLPYLGVTLLGIYASKAYRKNRRSAPKPRVAEGSFSLSKTLSQHSLKIYLIHQPLILGALLAWRWIFAPGSKALSSAHTRLFPVFFMLWQHANTPGKIAGTLETLLPGSHLLLLAEALGLLLVGLFIYLRARQTRE